MTQVSFRSLATLTKTASSSRVLNLSSIRPGTDLASGNTEAPFFASRTLNRGIIIKHRLRSNETDQLDGAVRVATKVVIPLVATDLKLGGQSFFVNQKGFNELIGSFNENNPADSERDRELLKLLDTLPSLDPFLLKERVARESFKIGGSYFAISEADQVQMNAFVAGEIEPLVRLSLGLTNLSPDAVSRLAHKILNSADDAEMQPIRAAFRMSADEYRESAFSWKGFLYYKWKMREEMDQIGEVARRIRQVNPSRVPDHFLRESIIDARNIIVRNLHTSTSEVFAALRVYEDAFSRFVYHSDATSFQRFLVMAPAMFLQVGLRLGVLSHIQSYWAFRFPAQGAPKLDFTELNEMLQEMASSLDFEPFSLTHLDAA